MNPSPAFQVLQWGERVEVRGGIPECLGNRYIFDSNCSDLHPNLWSNSRQECPVIMGFSYKSNKKRRTSRKSETVKKQDRTCGNVWRLKGFVSQTKDIKFHMLGSDIVSVCDVYCHTQPLLGQPLGQ